MAFFTILPKPLSSALFVITILHFLIISPLQATSGGFTVDLIPRDSPLSPFYNSSKTHYDSLFDAFQRSQKRINHFKSVFSAPESKVQTQITPGGGEFLMKASIGTPPVEFLGIADTGSDLIWTQCLPCEQCFRQNLPLFNPQRSSTYETIPCQSTSCDTLDKATCSGGQKNTCEYSYSYGDHSHTSGDLSSETFTIGNRNSVKLTKIVFGCAHDSGGTFDEHESGIIGLGGGRLSLISQAGESLGKKFSYCLVPTTSKVPGKISFGSDAVVSAPGAITTPLVAKSPDTYFYLTLEGVSVGDERIAYKGAKSTSTVPDAADYNVEEGNIIIDSGTTLTYLPSEFYSDLESAVERAVRGERVEDPSGVLSLCYKSNGDNLELPVLTAHFKGGDVKLQPLNTFQMINDDTVCFTLTGYTDVPTFGNLAQMNFNVGYDLEARTVSFLPTYCTKQ